MDFTGLIVRFPTNRALTERDRQYQLHQKRKLNVRPRHQLAVIKMNSTYLESVDKWFGWKGTISTIALAIILIFGVIAEAATGLLLQAAGILPTTEDMAVLLGNGLGLNAVVGLIVWACIWAIRKEAFAYTHYPIRFNRLNRMVYVWRTDGTVMSVRWDDVFFTIFPLSGEWEVRGYVLADGKETIKETFALSCSSVLSYKDLDPHTTQFTDDDLVRSHWEFIRRYMEEGPQSVGRQVGSCMAVDGRRERAIDGMHRLFANFSGGSWVMILTIAPVCLTVALLRYFAMRTSKIPRWPAEVDAECVIEEGDPYAITGNGAGNRVAVYPEAAAAVQREMKG